MSAVEAFMAGVASGSVEMVDLTAPLSSETPTLTLPDPFPNLDDFSLEQVSAYDEPGPFWKHHNIRTGEHIGTHLDAPVHWISGRDGKDVSEIELPRLVGPAVVLDFTAEVEADPDFLVDVEHLKAWQERHGAFPEGSWLLFRTGWDQHDHSEESFLNADETGSHTPGFTVECARYMADELPISGMGVETVGIDAGRGAKHAGDAIARLAEHTGALVATSAVVKGLFNGEDFNLGISGGFSSPVTAELISNADLIVGFGCAMNMWTMRHGTLIGPDARVVQVDVEDAALGRNRPIALGVLGDTAETAADVLDHIRAGQPEPRIGYRTEANRELIAARSAWASEPYSDLSTASGADARIDPRTLTIELNSILPAERIVSIDSGNFMGYPSQFLDVPDADGFCFTQAFQSIGLGLGTVIGAALARPDRMPVLGTGDGGFHMAIAELETAVRLRLPLVCIVYNDAAYGAEIHHFNADGSEPDMSTVTFPDTDIAAIARGFGAEGVTVRTVEDLEAVREWVASNPDTPLVIDAKIASDSGAWWLAEAFKGH